MKINKAEYMLWIIFSLAGVVFLIVGATLIFANNSDVEDRVFVTGVITEISSYRDNDGERKQNVYVSYDVDGRRYESKLNAYSSSFKEGKEIEIYYDRNNPTKIGTNVTDILLFVFPAMGLLLVVIGGTGIYKKIKKKQDNRKLKETGERIFANYLEVSTNTSYVVNGRYPYNIICKWTNPEDQEEYIFKSENIWDDPSSIIEEKNIKTFAIYLDPTNKKKYVMDIDEILNETVDIR